MWKIEIQILQKRKSSIYIIKKHFCCWNTILSHRQLIQLDTVCGLLSFVYVKFHGIIKFHWIIFAYVSQQQPSTTNGFRKVFIGLLNDCHSFWHKLATKTGQYKAASTEFNLFNLQMIPVALGIALYYNIIKFDWCISSGFFRKFFFFLKMKSISFGFLNIKILDQNTAWKLGWVTELWGRIG